MCVTVSLCISGWSEICHQARPVWTSKRFIPLCLSPCIAMVFFSITHRWTLGYLGLYSSIYLTFWILTPYVGALCLALDTPGTWLLITPLISQQLWATVWLLAIKLRSSGRADSALLSHFSSSNYELADHSVLRSRFLQRHKAQLWPVVLVRVHCCEQTLWPRHVL